MNAPLSEIALCLTGLTGQVFQTHARPFRDEPNELHAPGYACFYVFEMTYESPTRLRVTACGLECESPLRSDENVIYLAATRPAESIARDILRRLPDAPGVYQRANEYKAKKEKDKAEHAAVLDDLRLNGFETGYGNRLYCKGKDQLCSIICYGTIIERAEFARLTPQQLYKIMEIIE